MSKIQERMSIGDQDYSDLPQAPIGRLAEDTASILERIDPSAVAERLRYKLLGLEFDEKTRSWIRPPGRKPLINQEGAEKLLSIFSSLVNSNVSMSNLTRIEINFIMLTYCNSIIDMIKWRFQDFEIDPTEAQGIFEIMKNSAFFCLKRAFEQGERNFLKKSITSHEQINVGNNEYNKEMKKRRRWSF